jgi:hypothetical protein
LKNRKLFFYSVKIILFERMAGGTQIARKLKINIVVHYSKGKAIPVTGFRNP